MQRSFYVGDDITHEDIKAKFEDGILRLRKDKIGLQEESEYLYQYNNL